MIKRKVKKKRNKYTRNDFIIKKKFAYMNMHDQNGNFTKRTKMDIEDIDKIKSIKWCIMNNRYVHGNFNGTKILLHRYLMNAKGGQEIDHINGDSFDNRKSNMRFCTHLENCHNRGAHKTNETGYKGLHWRKNIKKYQVYFGGNYLGLYECLKQAIKVRRKAEIKFYKEKGINL